MYPATRDESHGSNGRFVSPLSRLPQNIGRGVEIARLTDRFAKLLCFDIPDCGTESDPFYDTDRFETIDR